ncbi:MAG TPA: hypothetical protein VFN87_18490 [Solirubrobacteraceae bacterium]|nr:hypothetical protein [Solirubrobacteraceae bacterium]
MSPTTIHHHELGLTWLEAGGMQRTAHALRDGERVWLIDPFTDDAALAAAAELGRPVGVIQLLDRHNRDGAALARRFEVPLWRLPRTVPDSPFTVVSVVSVPGWREVALWWEQQQALVVAEAVGTAPLFALGRRLGVHPMLRITPPRDALSRHRPERLLVGHGPPIESDAASALTEALAASRGDLPRLVLALPSLFRGG